MRTAPFMGRGIAFPFRPNPVTGGVQITRGGVDGLSVVLNYLTERWTIREKLVPEQNHIAEAIAHILLTHPLEHDTLPPFGSRLFEILFDPNTLEFETAAAFWFQHSTERWEKRARVEETDFDFQGQLADQGILPMIAFIDFIIAQAQGNLVTPFVTPRQARVQEYPSAQFDPSGHDYQSRYYGIDQAQEGDITYNRFPGLRQYPKAADDQYYKVILSDTWNLISWRNYNDIRYWPIIADIYAEDLADEGADREALDITIVPEPGTYLRVPSSTRLLMELSIPVQV